MPSILMTTSRSNPREEVIDRLIRQRCASLEEACTAREIAGRARKQRDAWMMGAFLELTVIVVYAVLQLVDWARTAL